MCDPEVSRSIVVAPVEELYRVAGLWRDLDTHRRFELGEPSLVTLDHVEGFWGGDIPGLLTVEHPESPGHFVADQLQVDLLLKGSNAVVEPDHRISLAHVPFGGVGAPEIALDPERVDIARGQLESDPRDLGHTVAVIDSGDNARQMLDMVDDAPTSAAGEDREGHGTAIDALIQLLRPDVEIHPIRVVRHDLGDARHLVLGLIAALWPDEHGNRRYDVVNVSISRRLAGECASSLGKTLSYVDALCHRRGETPPLVAAAGNSSTWQQFGYPAAFEGAIVAEALDWSGAPATYNVSVPSDATTAFAYGGTATDPFGEIRRGGIAAPLYGTSFAAALVTCRYLA